MEKINEYLIPYHWGVDGFYKRRYEFPVKLILNNLNSKDIVLDVGCGDGKLTSLISSRVKKVIGLDNQELPIKYAKLIFAELKINNVEFVVRDILSFNSKLHFDKITCFDVIEHLPTDKAGEFIGKIHSLLKDGGEIYITTTNRKSLANRLFGHKVIDKHYYEYSIEELNRIVGKHFFDIKLTGVYIPVFPRTGRYPDVFPFNYFFNFLIKLGGKFPSLSHTVLLKAKK